MHKWSQMCGMMFFNSDLACHVLFSPSILIVLPIDAWNATEQCERKALATCKLICARSCSETSSMQFHLGTYKKTPIQGCNPRYTTPSPWLLGPAVPRKQTSSANRACTLVHKSYYAVMICLFSHQPETINYYMYITCIFALHIKYIIPSALELGSPNM